MIDEHRDKVTAEDEFLALLESTKAPDDLVKKLFPVFIKSYKGHYKYTKIQIKREETMEKGEPGIVTEVAYQHFYDVFSSIEDIKPELREPDVKSLGQAFGIFLATADHNLTSEFFNPGYKGYDLRILEVCLKIKNKLSELNRTFDKRFLIKRLKKISRKSKLKPEQKELIAKVAAIFV